MRLFSGMTTAPSLPAPPDPAASRRAPAVLVGVAALALTCAISGCSGSSTQSANHLPAAPDARSAPQAASAANGAAKDLTRAPQPAEVRQLVKRASITLTVGAIETAAVDVRAAAAARGGEVASERITTNGPPASDGTPSMDRAELVITVPASALEPTLTSLSALGAIVSRTVSVEEVTGTVVDLQSRVQTMRASIDRLRTLMGQAQRIPDIVALESQLAQREAEYQSLTNRLAKLSSSVARSTITITLVTAATGGTNGAPSVSFTTAVAQGWSAFLRSAAALVAALGWLLPWLGAAVVLAAYPLVRRRRRRTRTSAPTTAPTIAPASASAADSAAADQPTPTP